MLIRDHAKSEIRMVIEEQLKNVPFGQRISLDNELLEELLFRKIVINKEKGLIAKIPTWSGDFLRKIDLSQISFEDVSFGGIFLLPQGVADENVARYFDTFVDKYLETVVDYSYTNANIDLTKLFEARFRMLALSNCNFEGLSFQNQDLSNMNFIRIADTNMSNTGIVIPPLVKFEANYSNFSNVDLSNRSINGNGYLLDYEEDLAGCCLLNTGIHIECDFKEARELIRRNCQVLEESKDKIINTFAKLLNEDWSGCIVNGKKVETVEDSIKRQTDESELISSIISSIQEQVSGFKTK